MCRLNPVLKKLYENDNDLSKTCSWRFPSLSSSSVDSTSCNPSPLVDASIVATVVTWVLEFGIDDPLEKNLRHDDTTYLSIICESHAIFVPTLLCHRTTPRAQSHPNPQCQVLYPYMKVITTYNDVASLQSLQWLFLCFWASQQVIAYCMIATLEIGFTAGFSTLKWGMEQIPKTQNIWEILCISWKEENPVSFLFCFATN